MTDAQQIAWDAHQQALTDEVGHLTATLASIPDTMQYTAARNRLEMAMRSLETARDQLSAARDRYTDAQEAK